MKKYKAYPSWVAWRNDITPVDCERETDSSVFIKGRRSAKISNYECYYDTWDAAHNALVNAAKDKTASARKEVESAENALRGLLAMRKPEDAE